MHTAHETENSRDFCFVVWLIHKHSLATNHFPCQCEGFTSHDLVRPQAIINITTLWFVKLKWRVYLYLKCIFLLSKAIMALCGYSCGCGHGAAENIWCCVSLWLNPILLYSSLKDLFFLLKPAQLSLIIVKYNDIDMQYLFKKSKKSKEV